MNKYRNESLFLKDETYERLTQFIQGWVGSEQFLNEQHTCNENCSFNKTKFYKDKNVSCKYIN